MHRVSKLLALLGALAAVAVFGCGESPTAPESPKTPTETVKVPVGAARPPDSLTLANAYNRLGIFLRVTGRRDSARTLLEKALGIRERGLDSLDLELASSYNNPANLYAVSGDLDRAIPLARRALALRETLLPPGDERIEEARRRLAGK